MPKKNSKELVADFLASPNRRQCVTCGAGEDIAHAIQLFVEAIALGSTKSWRQFHRTVLRDGLGFEPTYSALMKHVRDCIGIEKS